jgi:hydroxyacylglutathione hydrolase
MSAKLVQKSVGPWPMNTYVVICKETQTCAIIDPGAEANTILELKGDNKIEAILLTHGHEDHRLALAEVKEHTSAPVYVHPKDGTSFDISYDLPLEGNQFIQIGNLQLKVIHTPGHTAGQCSFDLGDDRIIVGDTLFVGGPGRTWSPQDFHQTMKTMLDIVFQWPDETHFYPGHGPSGQIGFERPAFKAFVERGWSKNLEGDVTWEPSK